MSKYIENHSTPQLYQLYGIVSYYILQKKYVTFCISPIDKQWYFYDDDKVGRLNMNYILDIHNNNGEFIPCILLYKSITS